MTSHLPTSTSTSPSAARPVTPPRAASGSGGATGPARPWWRTKAALRAGWAVLVSAVTAVPLAVGCLDRPVVPLEPKITNVYVDRVLQSKVTKIDLLFMIDNSISMADKQEILSDAVPDLVRRLVDPICVNDQTGAQQDAVNGQCDQANGFAREFKPINDIHIGVISSSLGSYGAGPLWQPTPISDEEGTDDGHLIGSRPRAASLAGGTGMMPDGFLAWAANTDLGGFETTFKSLVTAVGEFGSGFESSQEAWFHFLVDPHPWLTIATGPCPGTPSVLCASKQGQDDVILAQRRAFLRPDSLLAIIVLSDENDCSIRPEEYYFWAARITPSSTVPAQPMPRATRECQNPNDPCCRSCIENPPAGCQPDPDCATNSFYTLGTADDPGNLRCYNEKKRFGIDSLYPTARYVNALKEMELCVDPGRPDLSLQACPAGKTELNPLYVAGADGASRSADLVFLAGVVGVPWEDLKADVDLEGKPVPPDVLRYKTVSELGATWDMILGNPTASPPVPPGNPLMQESIPPRGGVPGVSSPINPIASSNGHEWANNTGENGMAVDLQYACIFPLGTSRDCTLPEFTKPPTGTPMKGCDCKADTGGKPDSFCPLCQNPADNSYGTTQYFAKAYPGLRHLQILKDYGTNSIVASICPRNTIDKNKPDYGYRPAIGAIIDRLKQALKGKCLGRPVAHRQDNPDVVACKIVQASKSQASAACNTPGLKGLDAGSSIAGAVMGYLQSSDLCGGGSCSAYHLCEILPADPQQACLTQQDYTGNPGWCYVEEKDPNNPNPLLKDCPATERQMIRFVGNVPEQGAVAVIACLGAAGETTVSAADGGP